MPLIMFVSSSFNTYVNLPKKKNSGSSRKSLSHHIWYLIVWCPFTLVFSRCQWDLLQHQISSLNTHSLTFAVKLVQFVWFQFCKNRNKVRQGEKPKFEWNTSDVRIFYTTNQFCKYHHVRSKQHTTPSQEFKFQM
jgi:hypothetical protein